MTNAGELAPHQADCALAVGGPPQKYSELLEERVRAHELAKFFSASSITPGISRATLASKPRPAPDGTLTALAQLGVFRLDCERSFISLIDREYQYIIGEATKSTSLLPNGPQRPDPSSDSLYLGFRALDLTFGVCPQTIQIFTTGHGINTVNVTADRTRYVIRDFCADPHFSARPYVTGWPHMRSYAEVPLTSSNGFVIGSYCVVDTKPRPFGDDDISMLSEIATTIMNHLELSKTKLEFDRVESLVRGIGSYVAGYSGLREQQTWPLAARAPNAALAGGPVVPSTVAMPYRPDLPRDDSSSEPSMRSSSLPDQSLPLETPTEVESADVSFSMIEPPPLFQQEYDEHEDDEDDRSRDVKTSLLRAGNLMRQAMGMQAVYFVDATAEDSTNVFSPSTNVADEHSDSTADRPPGSVECNILSRSMEASSQQQSADDRFSISNALLHRLLSRYPFGHVFSFDEIGLITTARPSGNHQGRKHPSRRLFGSAQDPEESTEEGDAAELFRASNARSLIFLPLWDFHKDRWFCATIGWTTDPTRTLDSSDLNYLAAFGNSIMAEVSRLETSALSSAKSNFISSVSHELRSPLHGILAATEILRESTNTTADLSLLGSIDSCGHILLDTMNHLLDFTKINSLTNPRSVEGLDKAAGLGTSRLAIADLSDLLQDVVDGIYLGETARRHDDRGATTPYRPLTVPHLTDQAARQTGDTVVLIEIDHTVDWTVETETGAWKRIIMNLFGNALKYTRHGQINVRLRLIQQTGDEADHAKHICLEVCDTGRGISKEYLQTHLYTPFSQENNLSDGIGLGLSIVLQLVHSLGGSVSVKSQVSLGTQVSVVIPFGDKTQFVSTKHQLDESTKDTPPDLADRLKGYSLCLPLDPQPHASYFSSALPRKDPVSVPGAFALLAKIAERWFGDRVILQARSESLDDSSIVNRFTLRHTRIGDTSPGSEMTLWLPVLPGNEESSSREGSENIPFVKINLRQPFGPRKLARALADALALRSSPPVTPMTLRSRKVETEGNIGSVRDISTASLSGDGYFDPVPEPRKMPEDGAMQLGEPGQVPNLLLVDDNPVNLRVLSMCLRQVGCTHTLATNGQEAIDAFKANATSFDLVFMDISMPVKDGYEATREIREHERKAGLRRVRIIALTALGSKEARHEAHTSGVDLFMSKPVKMSEIKALVESSSIAQNHVDSRH